MKINVEMKLDHDEETRSSRVHTIMHTTHIIRDSTKYNLYLIDKLETILFKYFEQE